MEVVTLQEVFFSTFSGDCDFKIISILPSGKLIELFTLKLPGISNLTIGLISSLDILQV